MMTISRVKYGRVGVDIPGMKKPGVLCVDCDAKLRKTLEAQGATFYYINPRNTRPCSACSYLEKPAEPVRGKFRVKRGRS